MKLDALAGLKPNLISDAGKVAGSRVLEGRFAAVQQSMGVPKARTAAAACLASFAGEITTSGLLRDLIGRHRADGLTIASQSAP